LPIGHSSQVISNEESDESSEDIANDKGDTADSEGDMRCHTLVKGEAFISILNQGL